MAGPVSDSGETAEDIAYRLLELIIANDPPSPPQNMNATWVVTTYARCLRTVKNPDLSAAKTMPIIGPLNRPERIQLGPLPESAHTQ